MRILLKTVIEGSWIIFLSIKFDPWLCLKVWINISLLEIITVWIREIPRNLKTQGMYHNETLSNKPCMLEDVPNSFKTQSMCEEVVKKVPRVLRHVPDYFKTPEMCNKTVKVDPWQLKYVPEDSLHEKCVIRQLMIVHCN